MRITAFASPVADGRPVSRGSSAPRFSAHRLARRDVRRAWYACVSGQPPRAASGGRAVV